VIAYPFGAKMMNLFLSPGFAQPTNSCPFVNCGFCRSCPTIFSDWPWYLWIYYCRTKSNWKFDYFKCDCIFQCIV